MKKPVLFICLMFLFTQGFCQISRIEYFLNMDPGVGNARSIEFQVGHSIEKAFNVPLDLPRGFHTLGLRVKGSDGKWSHTILEPFFVENNKSSNIKKIEYFIDDEPGIGKGISIPLTLGENGYINYNVPLNNVSDGFHILGIRSLDDQGNWSTTQQVAFFNRKGSFPPRIIRLEYYFVGEGAPNKLYTYNLPNPAANIDLSLIGDLSDLQANKDYTIHITAFEENGIKSNTVSANFSIRPPLSIETIEATGLTCFESNDGKAIIKATGSEAALEYSIDNVNYQASNVFENLTSGNYTAYVREKEAITRITEKSFTISRPTKLELQAVNLTQPECTNDNTGGFSINTSGGIAPYTYKLSSQATFQSSNSFSDLGIGNYIVHVKDAKGCESTLSVSIVEKNQAPPVPTVTVDGTDAISTEVSLMSSAAEGNQWFKNGELIPGATAQKLNITESGIFHVVVTGIGGCTSTSATIAITSTPEIRISNLKVYPNPANDRLHLDFGRDIHLDRIRIFNTSGNMVQEISSQQSLSTLTIELHKMIPGIYMIQLEGVGLLERVKFIKK
ncbi:T9SS type A sorting domain-containing protein [Belliella kenyensis]|uniref:T9SS type A sorting domain-containing protein n=1 Tax=Belliella kenyensis TaxID=1472724 RepID=A0ABV8ES22_9BACT|nr:T9SS type A sorting domain-containing protein [Belliella kenyensis]MCH7402233.1 T9SS type A sorting domain-containing protein [Belliella kenyensis]MDN3601747.1 T9SS type A sorting domain-containing protein [Belliella kenyensis]